MGTQENRCTHGCIIIFESSCESREYCILMLFLDYSWSSSKDAVRNLSLSSHCRHAKSRQDPQYFRPLFTYAALETQTTSVTWHKILLMKNTPLSEYSLAISATAS